LDKQKDLDFTKKNLPLLVAFLKPPTLWVVMTLITAISQSY